MIDLEKSVPARSAAGLAATDIFYTQPGGINFYVEDEDQENLYFEILRKLFPKVEISKIFPLGGKVNVLAHSCDPANKTLGKVCVYIVDKDFDDLLGHVVRKENVFYLDRYCVENFLFEENATVQIALECEPKKRREDIQSKLNFDEFLRQSIQDLDQLFRLFFVVQRFNLGLKNCDLKAEQFSEHPNRWKIQRKLVTAYKRKVRAKAKAARIFNSKDGLDKYLRTAFPRSGSLGQNISGKFLLGMLFHYLRSQINLGTCTHDSLCYRLARNGTLASLKPLKRRISSYLRKSKHEGNGP